MPVFHLKKGLSGNEELYYMSMLITITGYTEKEVGVACEGNGKTVKFAGYRNCKMYIL